MRILFSILMFLVWVLPAQAKDPVEGLWHVPGVLVGAQHVRITPCTAEGWYCGKLMLYDPNSINQLSRPAMTEDVIRLKPLGEGKYETWMLHPTSYVIASATLKGNLLQHHGCGEGYRRQKICQPQTWTRTK